MRLEYAVWECICHISLSPSLSFTKHIHTHTHTHTQPSPPPPPPLPPPSQAACRVSACLQRKLSPLLFRKQTTKCSLLPPFPPRKKTHTHRKWQFLESPFPPRKKPHTQRKWQFLESPFRPRKKTHTKEMAVFRVPVLLVSARLPRVLG